MSLGSEAVSHTPVDGATVSAYIGRSTCRGNRSRIGCRP